MESAVPSGPPLAAGAHAGIGLSAPWIATGAPNCAGRWPGGGVGTPLLDRAKPQRLPLTAGR